MGPAQAIHQKQTQWRGVRWSICILLFFATTINYIDRQVLGLLKPVLEKELGWSEQQYGNIVFAFQAAYALVLPIAGRLLDWLGTRWGYAVAVILWSIAAMSHAAARNAAQFSLARFALGLGEAANFPAAIKATTDWFPVRERALATGIFNSGSNIGAVVAPLMVPWIAATWGWQQAFIATGALGFVWLFAWLAIFRQPERHGAVSNSELAHIRSDKESGNAEAQKVPYLRLLSQRQAWAFLLGKFLTDPVWWFYLYWLPGFLNTQYGVNLTQLGPPLITIYLMADFGSIGGGWLSSAFLKRGWTVNRSRKTAMAICAFAVTGAIFIGQAGSNLWAAVALISLATAAHQGWSANIFTVASDLYPRRWIGSVIGLGGMAGAIGGMLVAPAVGWWLDFSGKSYGPLFVVAGSMYLLALLIMHLLVPDFDRDQIL